MVKILIHKSMASGSIELRVIKNENEKVFYLNQIFEFVELGWGQYASPLMSFPLGTEVEMDDSFRHDKELLIQKDNDKNDHIKSLENIINKFIALSTK